MNQTQQASLDELAEIFAVEALPFDSEASMHEAIKRVLDERKIDFAHEARLDCRDRIDFLVGLIGIEVKLTSSPTQVASQLLRYAEQPQIEGLLLITNKASHRKLDGLKNESNVPIRVCFSGFYGF